MAPCTPRLASLRWTLCGQKGPASQESFFVSSCSSWVLPPWSLFVGPISRSAICIHFKQRFTCETHLTRAAKVFWYTHHLFLVFFVSLWVHGTEGFVQKRDYDDGPDGPFTYEGAEPMFWKWTVGPVGVYLLERVLRFYRANTHTIISKVVEHPSKVIELQMKRKGFKAMAGQYIFVNIPEISQFEWHPFTLTSAPEEDFFSVHIRVVGDWTNALSKRLGIGAKNKGEVTLPKVCVDGPFGTASEDVFKYEVVVCVGAGIGVTPFASILKSIWYRLLDPNTALRMRKVYFFWICRDKDAFEWFADLLDALEQQLEQQHFNDFLTFNIYLTEQLKQNEVKNIMLNDEQNCDAITGLRSKTLFGRPNWDREFEAMSKQHAGGKIGVFFCGPAVLSKALAGFCTKYTSPDENGTRFVYNKENF
eukprot:Colp12_sorted_trinity150504_noHs@17901